MAQNDIQITTTPPLAGLTMVQGINGALQSLATDFAGSIDPAAIDGVGPYCTWADTGNGLLKRRNAAGTDWVVEGTLFKASLPQYAEVDIPATDIGDIHVIGKGTYAWSGSDYVPILASESDAGMIKVATTAEAQALVNDTHALTPAKLAAAFGGGNQNLSIPGYQKLPGGLIKQWGLQSAATPSGSTVTFPFAFPNAAIGVTGVVFANSSTFCFVMSATGISLGSFVLHKNYVGATQFGVSGDQVYWEALGY